jgi:hypothetical protein
MIVNCIAYQYNKPSFTAMISLTYKSVFLIILPSEWWSNAISKSKMILRRLGEGDEAL